VVASVSCIRIRSSNGFDVLNTDQILVFDHIHRFPPALINGHQKVLGGIKQEFHVLLNSSDVLRMRSK
jgi:hypothetical protein